VFALADRPVGVVNDVLDAAVDRHAPTLGLRVGLLGRLIRNALIALRAIGPAVAVLGRVDVASSHRCLRSSLEILLRSAW